IGDGLPRWDDLATQEPAGLALEGKLAYLRGRNITVGRRNIDWLCQHDPHHVWPGRLLRFVYLAHLASAYRATDDEAYALAARDYIEDWIDAHPPRDRWAITNPDNRLHLATRMNQGWGAALPALLPSAAFDDAFV